jgi:predicted nuclease of predicted toxin-antitoxin system
LANTLKPIFGECSHVDLMEIKGFPPKIVLLKTGNNSSRALVVLLININPMIEDLENNNYGLLEIVNDKKW